MEMQILKRVVIWRFKNGLENKQKYDKKQCDYTSWQTNNKS